MDQHQDPDRSHHLKPAPEQKIEDRGSKIEDRKEQPGAPARSSILYPRPSTDPPAPPAPPLTPMAWLAQNSPYLVLFLLIGVLLYRSWGIEGLLNAGKVALGLGFVIFIHELGHFLAAKWCDVHVQTFSIGFGPALPGCSFRRGETTYKIALLPLGGYVSMVGEGPEADEDEDYPRSFKNKPVGQRMLIISAGVIMNVLFGAVAFILVYRFHGEPRPPALIGRVDPGSPAWEAGVRPGWTITHIDARPKPYFDDMKYAVALSRGGRAIPFTFRTPDGRPADLDIEPRKDDNDPMPVIGVSTPRTLKLWPARLATDHEIPALYSSPAAFARPFDLRPGDVVLAATDPDARRKITPLPRPPAHSTFDARALCRRMHKLRGEPMEVRVLRAGGTTETLEVPTEGFQFADSIVGTTDADQPANAEQKYDPFRVKDLPPQVRPDGKQRRDPFEFRRRLYKLAGKPMVIQVRHPAGPPDEAPVSLLVPPAYHYRLGMRMKIGEITGIRKDSPAAQVALSKGDTIEGVAVQYGTQKALPLSEDQLDPVRLPYELTRLTSADPARPDPRKWRVLLTVRGTENHDANKRKQLAPMRWDATRHLGDEEPLSPTSPLSIPQLGLAYQVESTVARVEPGSPAARAGLQDNDVIRAIRFRQGGKKVGTDVEWGAWHDMASKRPRNPKAYDQWAYFFAHIQEGLDYPEVQVKVRRNGQDLEDPLQPMSAREDRTWPRAERGLLLDADTVLMKADSLPEAVHFGIDRTGRDIKHIYLTLSSLISGRVSAKNLGGPILIASQAFAIAGDNIWMFLLFLGVISINLAVVNFLPIPVLDGGHMVFLVYEKLRGRPPSEAVRAWATYVGLALILGLMVFVFYQDIMRLEFVRRLLGR